MKYKIQIFSGHFGSGKTEVALNFAMNQKKLGKKVTIVDFDIVNPYFRTNDAKNVLTENGIKLIANDYASTNLDMPTVPLNILSVFEEDSVVIFDVGGDDDGALALGQYKQYFDKYGYEMHFVVNTKRPLTESCEDLLEIAQRIEKASRLTFTDIYNNTNLSVLTDENTLFSDYGEIEKLSQKMGIIIKKNCGIEAALGNVPEKLKDTVFKMNIFIPKPWEIQ
ncbi:MAG: ATP-binding protein [Clostridia bacterium]|nr:ATP-binding protein [Clostridia bacterium]